MKTPLIPGLLLLCTFLVACPQDDAPDPDLSSETHWMMRCQDGQACDDGGQCICGVCTVACDDDTQCTDAGPLTVCAPTDDAALDALCNGEPPARGVCLAPCDGGEACGDVQRGLECQRDRCLPGPDTPDACATSADCDGGSYCDIAQVGACLNPDTPGVCAEIPEACIELFAPVCGCDGETYANDCFAAGAGINVAADGPCENTPDPNPEPGPEPTDCMDDGQCGGGQYCAFGTGECGDANVLGTCVDRPEACDLDFDPVCGCDGSVYSNACAAASEGINVLQNGECTNACSTNADCGPDTFCKTPAGACGGDPNVAGTCEPIPEACIQIFSPVCGCDGLTYGNECEANNQRQSIAATGECD